MSLYALMIFVVVACVVMAALAWVYSLQVERTTGKAVAEIERLEALARKEAEARKQQIDAHAHAEAAMSYRLAKRPAAGPVVGRTRRIMLTRAAGKQSKVRHAS